MSASVVLVIGHGRSAEAAIEEIAVQGGKAIMARIPGTISEANAGSEAINPGGAEVVSLEGSVGRFTAMIRAEGTKTEVRADAVVLAVDLDDWKRSPRPQTMSLSEARAGPLDEDLVTIAVVLGPGASRSAHRSALELGLRLRSSSPPKEVVLFAEEVLAHGMDELLYLEAQRIGLKLVRTAGPVEIGTAEPLVIRAVDNPSGLPVELSPDLLIREDGARSNDLNLLARASIDVRTALPAGVCRGPGASIREGIFLCGSAFLDRPREELDLMARAAATRALTSARERKDEGLAASVDQERCSACLTCLRSCPYGAPRIGTEGKAEIDKPLCQACGICVGACPSRAISLPGDVLMGTSSNDRAEARP